MKKIIALLIVALFFVTISVGVSSVSANGDENYNDHSNEYAPGDQPDSDDIPGMNRSEDRTRNKDS